MTSRRSPSSELAQAQGLLDHWVTAQDTVQRLGRAISDLSPPGRLAAAVAAGSIHEVTAHALLVAQGCDSDQAERWVSEWSAGGAIPPSAGASPAGPAGSEGSPAPRRSRRRRGLTGVPALRPHPIDMLGGVQ